MSSLLAALLSLTAVAAHTTAEEPGPACSPVVRPAPPRRVPPATGKQPHFVTLLVDDLGFDDLRSHDLGSNVTTFAPTVATLLSEGLVLDRHHAYKWCSPSRRSFLTGRFPVSLTGEQAATASNLTPLQFTLLSEKLQAAGYESHFVGKGARGAAAASVSRNGPLLAPLTYRVACCCCALQGILAGRPRTICSSIEGSHRTQAISGAPRHILGVEAAASPQLESTTCGTT